MFPQTEGSAQPSLNATKILSTELLIPSLAEQRSIVSYLENLHSELNLLHQMQAATALELDALLPSV
jgi:restriction endonuclease S subunit